MIQPSERMIDRVYRMCSKNTSYSCDFIWKSDGWIDFENSENPSSDEFIDRLGYDLNSLSLVPLPVDKQWEEILAINPTEIILKPTFIVVKYGDGFQLHHTCRTIEEGVCIMAEELYYKRLNPEWIKQTPFSLIGLVSTDQLRGEQT